MTLAPKNRVPAVAHSGTRKKSIGYAISAPVVAHGVAHVSLAAFNISYAQAENGVQTTLCRKPCATRGTRWHTRKTGRVPAICKMRGTRFYNSLKLLHVPMCQMCHPLKGVFAAWHTPRRAPLSGPRSPRSDDGLARSLGWSA
jgi:hypothetical protein